MKAFFPRSTSARREFRHRGRRVDDLPAGLVPASHDRRDQLRNACHRQRIGELGLVGELRFELAAVGQCQDIVDDRVEILGGQQGK